MTASHGSDTPESITPGTPDDPDTELPILPTATAEPARRSADDDHDAPIEPADNNAVGESDDVLVTARGLDFGAGPRRVFAGLDFQLPVGTLGAVHGSTGSGRSTLLLALIGRAPKLHGRLQVAGYDALRPGKALRQITTAARIATVVDVEPKHSIRDAVADRAVIDGISNGPARRTFTDLTDRLALDVAADDLVEDLDAYRQTLLALILAALRPSKLLVLDDLDRGLNLDDQDRLYDAIGRLMDYTGSTVVISTVEAASIPDHAEVITLPSLTA
jgi:ABC-type multidrug transport system ATPase subunit